MKLNGEKKVKMKKNIGDRISVYNCSSYISDYYNHRYCGDGTIVAIGKSDDVSYHGSATYYTVYTVEMDDGSVKKVCECDCRWAAPHYMK